MMIWQGRPQEALDSIATMNLESIDGGAAAVADVRACAFAQQGNKPLAEAEVARLWEAPAGRYYPLRTALLCIDDQDGLARLVTATLDDPDSRADTLLDLQAYSGQEQQPAFWQLLKARFTQMTQRADVQAAIAKYGVMGSWPMADG